MSNQTHGYIDPFILGKTFSRRRGEEERKYFENANREAKNL